MAHTNTSRNGSSGSLNFASRSSSIIRLPVRRDVESEFGHVGDFVLRLRHDDGHVGGLHELDASTPSRGRSSSGSASCSASSSARCDCPVLCGPGRTCGPRSALSMATYMRLAAEPPADEVLDQVGGDLVEPFGPGDEVYCWENCRATAFSWSSSSSASSRSCFEFVVEVLVDELQLGDAVLVVERDGGAVLDRVAEVVDRDVVAEHLAGQLLLAGDQRGAGEAEERRRSAAPGACSTRACRTGSGAPRR